MVKEYQSLNPSNARIEIDYEKDDVKMEYVHNPSAFKTCFTTFFIPVSFINFSLIFLVGLIISSLVKENNNVDFVLTNEMLILACFNIGFLIWIILSPMIIAFIFSRNDKLLKMMPEINYKLARGKPTMAEFNPKDVVDNKCEIPLFYNVGLDYEATEEFSKYLIKVKIIEHGFCNLIKDKKKLNPYLWKAIFFFKDKPKTGKLEVKFK